MKNITVMAFLSLLVIGCKPASKKTNRSVMQAEKSAYKKFFDYDEIDYYFNNFDESKIEELFNNRSRSDIDSIKMGVILGSIPKDINDLDFISKLPVIGFSKTAVERSKFRQIDEIFSEQMVEDKFATACIYVYRDILVFKKNNRVVGTAKICFSCMANEIRGTDANTENFGQEGDYEKLAKLLR